MSNISGHKGSTSENADQNWHLRAPRNVAHEIDLYNLDGYSVGINAENLLGPQAGLEGDGSVRVALCDLGVDWMHPALNARIDYDRARDFDSTLELNGLGSSDGRIEEKFDAHGTACAGLVCGRHPGWIDSYDREHFVGVAPESMLVPIRISTNFDLESLIAALEYAAEQADVILLPRVLPYATLPNDKIRNNLDKRIKAVADLVPLICACGNDGIAELAYPASHRETIAVGACNNRGIRSTYSQYGKVPDPDGGVDIVAPSNDIPVENREIVRLDLEEVKLRIYHLENEKCKNNIIRNNMIFRPQKINNYVQKQESSELSSVAKERLRQSEKHKWNLDRFGELSIATADNRNGYGYNFNPDGDYCKASGDFGFGGTSAAAAQVAGVVALMLARNPMLRNRNVEGRPKAIRDLLRASAHHDFLKVELPNASQALVNGQSVSAEFGYGLIDAAAAVSAAEAWRPA